MLSVTSETREQLCMMFTDLLTLVVEVATRFYKTVHGMMAGSVSLDMYEVFGDTIETFRDRRGKTSDLIWSYQIENEGINSDETVAIESLSKWLAPQDRVLDMLGSDHTTFADDQVEYTCLWFQDELTKFVKGSDECLLINARAGSGKTTLAASLIDRLQRPVARKSYSTLFCSIGKNDKENHDFLEPTLTLIAGSASSQANSLHVVNSLLYQLLNIRVGNMALYHALVRAYHHARQTADPKAYEDHLWNALKDALQHPLDNGNDTVLVINGLDDVQGGQSTGQALLDRLTQVVSDAKRTKMIALSKSLSLRSGTRGAQRNISPDDTRDDMHNVAIRSLARCRHFTSKAGPDQETIIANIIDAASGSFLWTILACETLKTEKTTEGFGKVVQSLKTQPPQSADLVSKLVSVLQPNADSALLLSWVVGAARPLTYDELQDLFAIDPQNPTNSNKRVDVHSLVQSIKPLLTLHHDVVRVRHTLVQTTLQTLLDQGKVPVPVKDRHTDMLLRILAYAKVTLHEKGDPTLDDTDQSLPARLFPRHHLLEYVIRYWPIHLKQTPMSPSGSSEPKPSPELQKVFPDSTMMPILEWLCWDAQYPGAQEVELHVLVGRLRKTIFTENHPTVLQSYINTATYYESMGNDREASKYYFLAITIAQNVLSQFHPVTIDCANRFLGLTEPMTTTSRTEVMTQRERVLLILISAYERQFGVSSELVIQTRQLLIDFYMHIHEEDHATDLIRVVRGTTAEKHGRDSDQGRDASNHLRVSLGNGKKRETLDTRKDGLFHDGEEEDETEEDFTLERVTVLRRVAEDYISQKKFLEAEQTYVLLWQQLSQRCRTTLSTDWHEKKIETVNAYAKFLKSQKRETETSAILVCLAQEYERHELSWSENIITRLLESAQTLKRAGHSTAALSIWRQASSYYKSTRKEQSSSFQQIEEEISVTSTEVLKHAVSSASTTDKTNTVSESSMESVFRSMIINTSKSIDISTMTIAKRLSTQYIEQRKWTEAISVIHSTLHRTWESFFAASLHDIQITTTFLQESVELVERLAEVYLQQRLLEKVIDVYTRLFRAALTSPRQHRDLLEKAKTLVIGFYDKYGYPDKAISIFQELLAVFRRVYGPNHDLTIQVLYELGTRCRTYARTHPYWIEYYQQISTAVNKDSDICHVSSIDAVILVATSYWEERRYTEAITSFTLLWNTFVKKTKEYKQFSDASFVQRLYERYAQSLEATQAEWDTLYRVTKQYQETCVTAFGAESAIYVSATLTLARVAESSEKHLDEAITLFETASKSKSKSSTKEDSVEIRRTVTKLYKRRITSSSSASSESVTKAVSVYQEQLAESKSQYGYAHSSTLNSLRELVMLQCRQQKTDVAVKEMITAVSEIITKETSDEKMLESASSIASMFQASQQTQPCTELVQELHRQLIAKEKRKSSKYTFDLTSSSSASLVFLAGLEYNIRSNTSLTFSEILSDIIAEHVYYEQFRRTMKARSGLDKIVMVAAPLRHFLLQRNRKDLAQSLEEQIVQLFIQRDTADLKLLSNESPKIFIVGILDHLGNRKLTNFVRAVILASNNSLSKLIENNKFAEGYDVANIAFIYAQYHKGYTQPKSISRGFELASYLDGRGENRCPDPALRKKLLQLSNSIIKEILNICHQQNINMAQVQLPELNQLIALLGEQGDYETLEVSNLFTITLLTTLILIIIAVTPDFIVEHPRCPALVAIPCAHQPRPTPHLRPLPCRPPHQGIASVRRHHVQLAPCARRSPPSHAGSLRLARAAVHKHRPALPEVRRERQELRHHCCKLLQESGPCTRRRTATARQRGWRRCRSRRR